MDVRELIAALGKTGKVATICGVAPQVVSNWIARGSLPDSATLHSKLLAEVRRRRIKLTAAELLALSKSRAA